MNERNQCSRSHRSASPEFFGFHILQNHMFSDGSHRQTSVQRPLRDNRRRVDPLSSSVPQFAAVPVSKMHQCMFTFTTQQPLPRPAAESGEGRGTGGNTPAMSRGPPVPDAHNILRKAGFRSQIICNRNQASSSNTFVNIATGCPRPSTSAAAHFANFCTW